MKTLNPQPVLASCSDELNFPFSQEARTSPSNDHIQFEPSPCPTNRVHLRGQSGAIYRLIPNPERQDAASTLSGPANPRKHRK